MNVFQELKKALAKGESFRFLYRANFYKQEIDENNQFKLVERKGQQIQLEGNQFEIPLRNQMVAKQIAIELSEWIRENAEFKTILGK